jgi:hypothetical protein
MNGEPARPIGRRQWAGEPLVLFVEGYSDLLFYAEMMEHLGKHNRCFIQDLGGKGRTKLEKEAVLLLKPDNRIAMEAVAVILDADDDSQSAFRLAQTALKASVGIEVSKSEQWVTEPEGKTRFGVFVVGGDDGKGAVETLAWRAWQGRSDNRPLRDCVTAYVDCVKTAGLNIHSLDKLRVGALLSVLNDEDPRLGPGARAKKFDLNAPELEGLRRFLDQM